MSKANKDNIILIGMPGCGKSTVGVVLAKHMGYRFIDSDLLIQEREHRLLSEIIEQEGLDRFDQIEEEVNASIEAEHASNRNRRKCCIRAESDGASAQHRNCSISEAFL